MNNVNGTTRRATPLRGAMSVLSFCGVVSAALAVAVTAANSPPGGAADEHPAINEVVAHAGAAEGQRRERRRHARAEAGKRLRAR